MWSKTNLQNDAKKSVLHTKLNNNGLAGRMERIGSADTGYFWNRDNIHQNPLLTLN